MLNATGYVVAQRKAAIGSKATGRLEWLGVAEGSRVKAGDVIARIDNRDVAAQAQSAEANVRAARAGLEQMLAEERDALAQLKRNQDLLAKGFVSPASVDTARARAERATAGVANARAAIGAAEAGSRNAQVSVDYTVIRAPFDGVILSKSANVGDMVTPFSSAADSKGAVVTMADMTHARGRGRRLRVAACRRSRSASRPRSRSTRCPTRASAAASRAWCRRSTARRRR